MICIILLFPLSVKEFSQLKRLMLLLIYCLHYTFFACCCSYFFFFLKNAVPISYVFMESTLMTATSTDVKPVSQDLLQIILLTFTCPFCLSISGSYTDNYCSSSCPCAQSEGNNSNSTFYWWGMIYIGISFSKIHGIKIMI